MIDPFVFEDPENEGRYRYAVIEDGQVRVEDGTLGFTPVGEWTEEPTDDTTGERSADFAEALS
jgi:hypothetical protein